MQQGQSHLADFPGVSGVQSERDRVPFQQSVFQTIDTLIGKCGTPVEKMTDGNQFGK